MGIQIDGFNSLEERNTYLHAASTLTLEEIQQLAQDKILGRGKNGAFIKLKKKSQ